MSNAATSNQEILERFARVVAQSLRIEASLVTEEAYLDDLGAESLDLAEITMESEEEFDVLIAQKTILQTATEVFGEGVLVHDGKLTEEGKRLLRRRMPDFPGDKDEITVADLGKLFLRVGTWVRMIRGLTEHTPRDCAKCGAAYGKPLAGRLKCRSCGFEHDIPSGEDLNRQWVQQYYQREYVPSRPLAASPPAPVA
ncbi:MAG TPA: acyl carrier protein [Actinomycetota bacterium]|nr:acyl carrier protein [Actinomycetota bacterium]